MPTLRTFTAVFLSCWLSVLAGAREPVRSPSDNLRDSVAKWVEVMHSIQKEEDKWEHDREVLCDYRDGLRSEIEDLENAIAEAKKRKSGADKDSVEQVDARSRYAEAKIQLAGMVRELETMAVRQAERLPGCLLAEPKMAQVLEEIRTDVGMLGNQADKQLAKRLNNILMMAGETEKFQQSVHLRDELHTRTDGREFNMKMVYFGLGTAFGVNEGGDFAIVGRPGPDGWSYDECDGLAGEIHRLVEIVTGDVEAGFVFLPIELR